MFKNPKVLFLVFLLPVVLLAIDFSGVLNDCDNCLSSQVMHTMGGVSMALIFFIFVENEDAFVVIRQRKLLFLLSVVSFVALIGVAWELGEFSIDHFSPWVLGYLAQPSLTDTMVDLFFDLVGSLLVMLPALLR